MKRIDYGRDSYLVSDRYATELVGHLSNRFKHGDLAPAFYTIHHYAAGAHVAVTRHAEVLIVPNVPLVVSGAGDYYDAWDEPDDTEFELYYLTSWKGEEHSYKGE